MSTIKILVVEGCTDEILAAQEQRDAAFGSHSYRDSLLFNAPDAEIHIAYPYAPARDKDLLPFDAYDWFALTGSAVAWGAEMPEAQPYLAYVKKVLATGKPVLGSCWGMQTIAVLLGGMSGPNPKGSEIGIARNITLTAAGETHPLFEGVAKTFDSPCWHRDHVTRLPEGAVLLASNAVSDVQAMAYTLDGMDYMGFQFHPEVPLENFKQGYDHSQKSGTGKFPGTICELVDFPDVPPADIADITLRTKPIANWLKYVANRKLALLQAAE